MQYFECNNIVIYIIQINLIRNNYSIFFINNIIKFQNYMSLLNKIEVNLPNYFLVYQSYYIIK